MILIICQDQIKLFFFICHMNKHVYDPKDVTVMIDSDAFGSFGALDGKMFNDDVNFERD